MRALALFLVAGVALATMNPVQFAFTSFMRDNSKLYESADEMFRRYNIFSENLAKINAHNARTDVSFWLEVNQFADLTTEEFKANFLRLDKSASAKDAPAYAQKNAASPCNPSQQSCDWRAQNVVNPIKDQAQCGSCWAFSTVGSVESGYAIASGNLLELSEQQLVDCAGSYGNFGCNGGLMDYAFQYVQAKGLCSESDYPYTAQDGQCQDSTCTPSLPAGTLKGYTDIQQGNEGDLQKALADQPVSVAVDAESWQFYAGGVLKGFCGTDLDHGVVAVGWGTDASTPYWIVRNSWGTSWGEDGYIRVLRGKNECGIALAASTPNF